MSRVTYIRGVDKLLLCLAVSKNHHRTVVGTIRRKGVLGFIERVVA